MAKRDAVPKTQDGYLKWHDTLKAGVTATTTGATAADVAMFFLGKSEIGLASDIVPATAAP